MQTIMMCVAVKYSNTEIELKIKRKYKIISPAKQVINS